jgi:hypothetical protein
VARPSIVPIALTLDDRTGYTLWAPPWEEDGEEWQAFLGTTVEDGETGGRATVHLFPTPAALAAFCRTATDHDLADHPVWPVVIGLGAADLTPDDDHRYDLDGVYDIAAERPDRWAVDELAATVDMVGRLAECLDTSPEEDDEDEDVVADEEGQFEAVAELVAKPEIGSLGLGVDAFAGRSGEQAWAGVGRALDELWEDVVEELGEHMDWTGAGTVTLEDYPAAAAEDDADPADVVGDPDALDEDDIDDQDVVAAGRPAAGATARSAARSAAEAGTPGVSTIRGNSRVTATPAAAAAAAEFWEAVGILPVEIVVPDGAGLTLRCYVDDEARFLGRDGEIFLFDTPADLARFAAGRERHDLSDIASWPEVADTDTLPLPAEEDRYDLTELSEVLTEVVDGGATGLVAHRVFTQPVEGVRDIAEYADIARVEELLGRGTALARVVARSEREPDLPLQAEDAAAVRSEWDEVVTAVSAALVFRD